MEEIMKEIVDADKEARARVAQKKQECRDIQNLIQQQKEAIKKKYQEETKACVTARRKELDEELAAQLKQEQCDFEVAKENLTKKYEDSKTQWIDEIYDRCLNL